MVPWDITVALTPASHAAWLLGPVRLVSKQYFRLRQLELGGIGRALVKQIMPVSKIFKVMNL